MGPGKDILKFDETSLMMIFAAMGLKIMETPSLIVLRTIREAVKNVLADFFR